MTNIPSETDIFIIGAGPAGAAASLFLAKKSIAHVIVDAAKFPRDKVCGDGLDLKVVRVLNALDPRIVAEELPAHPKFLKSWGLRAWTPDGRKTDFFGSEHGQTDGKSPLWTAKRIDFDDFLVKKIDPRFASFHENTKVTSLRKTPDGWEIEGKKDGSPFLARAKFLVGADGDHSVVLRHLGEREIDRNHYAGTVRMYHRNVAGIDARKPIELYFPPRLPMSYFYMFPLAGEEVNVGFGMVSSLVSARKINLREEFVRLLETDPILKDRFAGSERLEKPVGWGIPLASRRRKTVGDGYILIGDAASMVCPTSGEGIGTGMFSGLIAAEFLEKAFAGGRLDQSVFRNFDREIYKRLEGEIRAFRATMALAPWAFWDFGIRNAAHSPIIRRIFQNAHPAWIKTAYETPIRVEVG